MKRLIKFFQLTSQERRLLTSAVLVVMLMRLGLWVLPFRLLCRLNRLLSGWQRRTRARGAAARQVGWAVEQASRFIPLPTTCLTKALAGEVLLARHHQDSRLCIGVRKDEHGHFQAHAWVLNEGAVLIGNLPELAEYTLLPDLRP